MYDHDVRVTLLPSAVVPQLTCQGSGAARCFVTTINRRRKGGPRGAVWGSGVHSKTAPQEQGRDDVMSRLAEVLIWSQGFGWQWCLHFAGISIVAWVTDGCERWCTFADVEAYVGFTLYHR